MIEIYGDMACTNLINTINGNLINDSLTVDSESKQRRTYNCNLVVDKSFISGANGRKRNSVDHFQIAPDSYIWMNRYIKVYYGVKSNHKIDISNYTNNTIVKIQGNIMYWLVGTFTFITPNYTYDATNRTLSLTCSDYMSLYDGTRNGQITGNKVIGQLETEPQLRMNMSYNFKICAVAEYADETNSDGTRKVKSYLKVKDAILATLWMAGIASDSEHDHLVYDGNNYSISGYDYADWMYIPYDMSFEPGQTWCDVWSKINELYPNHEFFFDRNGRFIWRDIPTGWDSNVVLTNAQIDPLLVTEEHNNSFSGIYNATEVWGKSMELSLSDRYVETSTYNNGVYSIALTLTPPVLTQTETEAYGRDNIRWWFSNNDKIAIKISQTNTTETTSVKITGTSNDNKETYTWTLPVIDSSGRNIPSNTMLMGQDGSAKVWIFTYHKVYIVYDNSIKNEDGTFGANREINDCLVLSGSTQCYGYYEETNKDCPYSTANIDLIVQRISMDSDYTDDLCYNRAERMTYESCAMKDTVTLTMIIVPWLDVNEKIAYVTKQDTDRDTLLVSGIEKQPQWMIKNISWSTLDGTMNVTAYRYREDFQWVWDRKYQNQTKG